MMNNSHGVSLESNVVSTSTLLTSNMLKLFMIVFSMNISFWIPSTFQFVHLIIVTDDLLVNLRDICNKECCQIFSSNLFTGAVSMVMLLVFLVMWVMSLVMLLMSLVMLVVSLVMLVVSCCWCPVSSEVVGLFRGRTCLTGGRWPWYFKAINPQTASCYVLPGSS